MSDAQKLYVYHIALMLKLTVMLPQQARRNLALRMAGRLTKLISRGINNAIFEA